MKNIYKFFVAMAMLAASAACSKEWVESRTGLKLSVSPDLTYVTKAGAAAPEVDLASFDIHIKKSTGEFEKTWKYGELPSMIELSEGSYVVTASSPDQLPVAWDQPVYASSEEFEIIDGTITTLSLVCTVQNMKVTVALSENMVKELSYYEVKVGNEDGYLMWYKEDIEAGKAGFFSVKPLMATVKGTRVLDGTQAVKDIHINEVAARDHHKLNIDAKVTGQGNLVELSIDNSMVDKDVNVIIPGFDDVVPGGDTPGGGDQPVEPVAAPEVAWAANPDFSLMEIAEGMDVTLDVTAPAGISSFTAEVSENLSPTIQSVFGEPHLDFINNTTLIETLADLAPDLPTGQNLQGQTAVKFPMSSLVILLGSLSKEEQTYVFTLKITDAAGGSCTQKLQFHKLPQPNN